ncbi:uncharacterized protein topaz1 [Colossoma macropomum]|uniref:uncharacterized protein topaz1 n=1 Tax=Colossoma macropomum TaxID=42526 RepID=UPI001864A197|nr:uncharacterized protein topaz1 [Colossoma macropomum]
MQPSHRIKLNRSAFRLESVSAPKRRRTVCDPRVPFTGAHAADPARADRVHREPPIPPAQEPVREPAGEPGGGRTAHQTGYDSGTAPLSAGGVGASSGGAGIRSAGFAPGFGGEGKHVRHAQTEPATAECYVNGKMRVESASSSSAPTERARAAIAERRPKGRSGASTGLKETDIMRLRSRASNCNKNAELKRRYGLVTRFGSGRHVKRSVKSSCCALCGDVKYTPPASKKRACVRKPGSRRPDPLQRWEGAKLRPAAQAQLKPRLVMWPGKFPKVKLCDVARVFDVTSRDFSCVLPAALCQKREHKGVQCFKKEYVSLMQRYHHGNWKWITSQMWKVCAPTNSCASLSSGERVSDIFVRHEGCTGTADNHVARILDHERMTLTSGEGTACVPSNHDGVQHSAETGGSAVASVGQEEAATATPVLHVPPLVLRRVPAFNGIGSPYRFQGNPAVDHNASAAGESEECCRHLEEDSGSEDSEGEAYSPLSFSCQRTQAYVARPLLSCARTYKSWPFSRRGPPSELKTSVLTGPRWIVTPATSDVTDHGISKVQTSLSVTFGETVRENLYKLLQSSVKSIVDRNGQGQSPSANLSKMEKKPFRETESLHLPQLGLPRLVSVEKCSAEAEVKCSPEVFCDQDNFSGLLSTQHDIPDKRTDELNVVPTPEPVSVPQLRLVEQKEPISKASSEMVRSKTEPQATSSVMSSNAGVETRTNLLHPEKTDPPDSTGGRRWKKSFNSLTSKDDSDSSSSSSCSSSSSEDYHNSNLSSSSGSEGPSLQDEMCEPGKADRGSSPVSSPKCSAVARADLDVLRAYEEDAIVLDVIQDDPELFGAVVKETEERQTQKISPEAGKETGQMFLQPGKTSMLQSRQRIVWGLESTRRTAHIKLESSDGLFTVEAGGKAQSPLTQLVHSRTWTPRNPVVKPEQTVTDCNNNLDKRSADLNANSAGSSWLVVDTRSNVHGTAGIGSSVPKPSPVSYCRFYFSEHHSCLRNMCWFLHLPRDEDEKFCMETVQKFCRAGSPSLVQRAVEVFVGYYRTNSPGASFSQNIVNSLLSSLLNLALLTDLLPVINTLLSHNKTPPPELVMALYEHVRERGQLSSVPELIFLTSKMIDAGCVFTVNQCEMMQSELQMLQVPRKQMDIFHAVKCRALAANPLTAELSALSEAVVQVEVCKQQENWPGLASVFCGVCAGRYSAGELARFCCCVTTALLKEPKDKLTLPYEPFAESVCQVVPPDGLVKSFLGRVGVSLMFRYHRTHEWAKGVKLVLVMSRLHMEFSKLKGLFGSEDGTSRCQLITIATELFLQSGSIEGALNVLRADEWFVSSSTWPCDQADVENRRRVLTSLAGKTSHRDTLEILSNLPGLRQPLDGVQLGEYCGVFNAHLQKCMMNQVLLVAADTLEFMLTQGISAEPSQLQNVIHKLGRQNVWSRGRALFKRALCAGHYSEVLCERDSLSLPCSLSEIEMTLAFEMFITCVRSSLQSPGDPSSPLLIILRRSSCGEAVKESVYLAAGCRLLSAALIPNPKLSIRYVAVNQHQEQFFHLDRSSATKWLSHNQTWAQEMWTS